MTRHKKLLYLKNATIEASPMEKFSRPADEIETLLVNTLDGLPRDNQEKIRAFLGHLSKIFGSEEGFNTELTLLHNKLFCDDASAPLDEARFQEIATDARRGDVYNAVGKAAWNIVEKAAALGIAVRVGHSRGLVVIA